MSAELDDVSRALFNGQIPGIWRKLAPATLKTLANWMLHFLKRHEQYMKWINDGEPAVMWLSGLHIPGHLLEERLAPGQVHSLHSSHPVGGCGRGHREGSSRLFRVGSVPGGGGVGQREQLSDQTEAQGTHS